MGCGVWGVGDGVWGVGCGVWGVCGVGPVWRGRGGVHRGTSPCVPVVCVVRCGLLAVQAWKAGLQVGLNRQMRPVGGWGVAGGWGGGGRG